MKSKNIIYSFFLFYYDNDYMIIWNGYENIVGFKHSKRDYIGVGLDMFNRKFEGKIIYAYWGKSSTSLHCTPNDFLYKISDSVYFEIL